MTARSFARLLAPLALVACAVALFAIVTSGAEDGTEDTGTAPAATATATDASRNRKAAKKKAYVVKPGDTPSSIAEARDVALEDLLAANPDIDPNALAPGDELTIP